MYLPLPTHESLLKTAQAAVASQESFIVIRGVRGVGKSTLLAELVRRLRSPWSTVVRVDATHNTITLLCELLRTLGSGQVPPSEPAAWAALARYAQLRRWQEQSLLIAVDNADELPDLHLLGRLGHLDPHKDSRVAIVCTSTRPLSQKEIEACPLTLRLGPLTRSEAADFLARRGLHENGCRGEFSAATLSRLHARARGNPQRLQRLARQAARMPEGKSTDLSVHQDLAA